MHAQLVSSFGYSLIAKTIPRRFSSIENGADTTQDYHHSFITIIIVVLLHTSL